jgi:hypothetical protein
MANIKIELDSKYREYLDFLKQSILDDEGNWIESDEEIVSMLIENFVWLIQEQEEHHHHHHSEGECWTEGECCGRHKH